MIPRRLDNPASAQPPLSIAGEHSLSGASKTTAKTIKRAIDLLVAIVALPVVLPVMALLGLLCLAAHGRPVMFRQVRVARGGRTFTLPKFRTMTDARDSAGELLPDDQRVTVKGKLLRRFRLDELPSLIAVLKGDLSLVGPRPLPPYVLVTIPGSSRRHCVQPGFTGLSQVSGNTLLSNDEKLAIDLFYIRHWSLTLDLSILVKTVQTIIAGERRNEPLIRTALAERNEPVMPGELVNPRDEAV